LCVISIEAPTHTAVLHHPEQDIVGLVDEATRLVVRYLVS
jgi:hypothetical protein